MNWHVVDTNVLIVASGEHPESPFSSANHPVESSEYAEQVFNWVCSLATSAARMVMDCDDVIYKEYRNKLTEQDYGLIVLREKMARGEMDYVALEWEEEPGNPDPVAVLQQKLKDAIHDLSDRKMVAACITANDECGKSTIVNACDTDWIECEEILQQEDVVVEQLIDEWVRAKWKEKQPNQ